MTDIDSEVSRARAALGGPAAVTDPDLLGAVRTGLLAVPTDSADLHPATAQHDARASLHLARPAADPATLAVRRREAG